ncbi:hypothetical protein FVEG_15999 [Fusarium verticillioides 7600]|uniref:Uncharacterized protein n=1 Tax=Gibberella moniliformis (strain M3125 / FGSC 7600) TaxID=334819 RepID=W7MPL8_GIBM7|nr:hypothetical protein FVEG_15999 [Fusarium verticillioides 7600]EWG46577.1 hypothetical protein FVEG_15999 [Fusarium verticillioides 7600]
MLFLILSASFRCPRLLYPSILSPFAIQRALDTLPALDVSRVFVSSFSVLTWAVSSLLPLSASQGKLLVSTHIRFVQPESKLNPAQDQGGPPKARPGSVGCLV